MSGYNDLTHDRVDKMGAVDALVAVVVLVVVVSVGTVVHELSHAVALRAVGIPCSTTIFPGRSATGLERLRRGWASVEPRGVGSDVAPWRLRVAALMPLTLAAPFVLVAAGFLPDPVSDGAPVPTAATIAWLACALPSPQDFSLVWYADRALEQSGPSSRGT